MKQYITEKQWNQLSKKKKITFVRKLYGGSPTDFSENNYTPDIGEMIQFLGKDLWQIERAKSSWKMLVHPPFFDLDTGFEPLHSKELIDCLWQGCVYKLNW